MKKVLRQLIIFSIPFLKLYWRILKPRTQGVKILLINKNSVLMIRNTYGQKAWTFPGGGVKRGELPEETAQREVAEELGIKLTNVKGHGSFLSVYEGKRDTIWIFTSALKDKKFKADDLEIAEARWFSVKQLRSGKFNLSLVTRNCLRKAGL